MLKLSCLTLLLAINTNLYAEQTPIASTKDKRIKYVEYDARDIVKLYVTKGIMTQIEFSPEEVIINDDDAIYGESSSWVKWKKNNFYFIKPSKEAQYSNLFIQTNKRNYKFIIYACHENCQDKLTYSLIFTYGTNKNSKDFTQTEQQKAAELLKTTRTPYKNYQYVAKGSQDIKPIDAWDNGKFTYLKFANHKAMPSIYSLESKGVEVLTNSHIENKTIVVVHQLAKNFVLRLGNKALLIKNENYDKTPDSNLNTISPLVERSINEK